MRRLGEFLCFLAQIIIMLPSYLILEPHLSAIPKKIKYP